MKDIEPHLPQLVLLGQTAPMCDPKTRKIKEIDQNWNPEVTTKPWRKSKKVPPGTLVIDMDECCAMFIRESTQKSYDDVTKIFLHEANNLGAQMMAANHNFIVLLMKLKANMVTQMIEDHAQRY